MNRNSRFAAWAAIAASLALSAQATGGAARAAELTIAVSGVNSAEGRVYVTLHRAAAGVKFPDMKGAVAGAWRKAKKGGFSISFAGLEPGRYAVNGFHDSDGDGKIDTNLLGIPTEGYGFGNGAAGGFGPPDFDASSIDVKEAAAIQLPIGYPDTAGTPARP